LLLILGQWREHGGSLMAVMLAGTLSAACVSFGWSRGALTITLAVGIVVLVMTGSFLLATLLATWSQSDIVTLRAAGAPPWLAPLMLFLHVVGMAGGSTLVGLLLCRWVTEVDSLGRDATILLTAILSSGMSAIVPAWGWWRVDLSEAIRRR
jgi:ABC-type lipoprotein release transport system permease subunit